MLLDAVRQLERSHEPRFDPPPGVETPAPSQREVLGNGCATYDRRTRQVNRGGACFKCGKEGHFARGCDFGTGGTVRDEQVGTAPLAHSGSEVELVANNHSARLPHGESRRVYLEVLLDGELVDFLLDTGARLPSYQGIWCRNCPSNRLGSKFVLLTGR